MGYDHNRDVPEHPRAIYEDSEASRYVAGTAWHEYGGRHEAMSDIKERFPDKDVWFTEASGGEWVPPFRDAFLDQMKHVIRTTRNWSKSVVWWNMALDEENGPTVLTCDGTADRLRIRSRRVRRRRSCGKAIVRPIGWRGASEAEANLAVFVRRSPM